MGLFFWLWHGELDTPNRARFQRLMRVAGVYDVVLLSKDGSPISDRIRERVCRIIRSPTVGNSVVDYFFYFLTASGVILVSIARKPGETFVVYSVANLAAVPARLLTWFPGGVWVADILDDPRLDVESMYVEGSQRSVSYLAYRTLLGFFKRFLSTADLVWSVGINSKSGVPRDLREVFGVPPDRLVVVPNGTDLSITPVAPDRRDPAVFQVCYLGFMSKRRGLDFLLESAFRAASQIPNFRLVLAGNYRRESDRAWLEDEICRYRGRLDVRYLGLLPREGVLRLLSESDVCLYVASSQVSNYRNTMPIKVAEYLASNRAVIAPDFPGVRFLIEHEQNGLLYEPDNAASLAKQIQRLAVDPELKERLGKEGRKRIEAFDWARIHELIVLPSVRELFERKSAVR